MSFPDEQTRVYRSGYIPRTDSPTPAYPISAPTYMPKPPADASWVVSTSRSRLGVVLVAVLAGLVLLGGAALVSIGFGIGPGAAVTPDKGVRACKAIAGTKSGQKIDASGLGSGKDGIAVLRDAFNHSRYSDLKTAGTEAMDLMRQFAGASGDQATGLAIVAGGQMVQKWSALSGACSAHGVDIPSLADMGK